MKIDGVKWHTKVGPYSTAAWTAKLYPSERFSIVFVNWRVVGASWITEPKMFEPLSSMNHLNWPLIVHTRNHVAISQILEVSERSNGIHLEYSLTYIGPFKRAVYELAAAISTGTSFGLSLAWYSEGDPRLLRPYLGYRGRAWVS